MQKAMATVWPLIGAVLNIGTLAVLLQPSSATYSDRHTGVSHLLEADHTRTSSQLTGSPCAASAQRALEPPRLHVRLAVDATSGSNCSCAQRQLCRPVRSQPPPKELFVYYLFGAPVLADAFENVDWNRVTTVASIHAPPDALICAAHAHARRVVLSVDPGRSSWFKFDLDTQLTNATARDEWVRSLVRYAQMRGLDGVNLDIEDNLPSNRAALTLLTAEVRAAFLEVNKLAQVSFATRIEIHKFAGSTQNFDYHGLANHTDFFFIMGYDMNKGPGIANSDAPLQGKPSLTAGLEQYLQLGIPPLKLVMGFALFASDFTCTTISGPCHKGSTMTRLAYSGDRGTGPFAGPSAMELLAHNATTRRPQWSEEAAAPFFEYISEADSVRHQVWYQDNNSLALRTAKLVAAHGLRGAGAFMGDFAGPRCDAEPLWQGLVVHSKHDDETSKVAPRGNKSAGYKHLFLDRQLFANVSAEIDLTRHQPHQATQHNEGRVLWPRWPSPRNSFQGFGAYSGLMSVGDGYRLSDGTIRMYYSCHAQVNPHDASVSNGVASKDTVSGLCLAVSHDGLEWTLPRVGTVEFQGSTDNNCVMLGASGSVFFDTNPAAPAHERYKFVGTAVNPVSGLSGSYAAASPDGLGNWTFLSDQPALNSSVVPQGLSDTCDTGWWDEELAAYVLYVRMDCHSWDTKGPSASCSPTGQKRRIGRCVTPTLHADSWLPKVEVFAGDEWDPPGRMDTYTNAATRYEGLTLFFPAIYFHFSSHGCPFNLTGHGCDNGGGGANNDGLWESRFLFSRNGRRAYYAGADERGGGPHIEARGARSPFFQNGNNGCAFAGSVDDRKGWCDPFTGGSRAESTRWDTSMVAGISGLVLSEDGQSMYLYKWGAAHTHHEGGHCPQSMWANNTGIAALVLRRDGFVSVDAPYLFPQTTTHQLDLQRLPTFTTVPLALPSDSYCEKSEALGVSLNVVSAMVGLVLVELQNADGEPIPGFTLVDADAIKGSYIDKVVSWQHGGQQSVTEFSGKKLKIRISMADASLYSVEFRCFKPMMQL